MSIYSLDPFLPMFGENFHYTPAADGIKRNVRGVIDREGAENLNVRGSDLPVHNYPMVVFIKKSEISLVTQGADTVDTVDLTGKSVSLRMKKILVNDPETWVLGVA